MFENTYIFMYLESMTESPNALNEKNDDEKLIGLA